MCNLFRVNNVCGSFQVSCPLEQACRRARVVTVVLIDATRHIAHSLPRLALWLIIPTLLSQMTRQEFSIFYCARSLTLKVLQSLGPEPPTQPSQESLKAFYEDVERREMMERKLSKRKSNPSSSNLSRSLKRFPTAPPVQSPIELTRNPSSGARHEKGGGEEKQQTDRSQQFPRLKSSVSVNAGVTNSVVKDTWTAVPLPTFKVKYHLHDPLGPRWYKNHHLIPPSQTRPSMRPPTFFSSSFPPISTSSMPEHSENAAGASGTPSQSPLPTPDSSQTRVADGGKPRSRKTSQTTPDNVDLLDVTDPWGTNWHHQSPYDVFSQAATSSLDPQDVRDRSPLF